MSSVGNIILRLSAEFAGTFVVTLAVACTGGDSFTYATALWTSAIFTLMISNAHFNPAVTIGVLIKDCLQGRFETARILELVAYIIVQLVAAFLGGSLAYGLTGRVLVIDHVQDEGLAFLAELVFTAAVVLVYLSRDNLKFNTPLVHYAAVAATVFAGVRVCSNISSGALNPALNFALQSISDGEEDNDDMEDVWLYLIANILAGVAAPFLWYLFNLHKDDKPNPNDPYIQVPSQA